MSIRLEPTHKKPTFKEKAHEFWLMNHLGIGLIIITFMIIILLIMFGYALGAGHFHMFSTEANNYEHLNQIVTNGGVILWL